MRLLLISLTLIVISCSEIDDIVGQIDDYICVIKHTYTDSDNASEIDFSVLKPNT